MQRHVEMLSRGLILRGYLHLPEGAQRPPIVCMFHGFTGNKMEDHFYYVRLSRQFERSGIASLRMDFGDSGESDGSFEDMTPEGEIQDALNIIDFAGSLKEVDGTRLGVIGFSMGGMVAAIAAAERKEAVKSLCLISPAVNLEKLFSQFFEDNREVADINGLLFSKKALENMKDIDTIERAGGFDGPVLIVHGTEDQAVPLKDSRLYEKIYGERVRYHYIEGANHIFSGRVWEEEMRREIVEFIRCEL